jgi:hypothetical protein
VFATWREAQEQLLASERRLGEAWLMCAAMAVPEPKELQQQVEELRAESDRLLRNAIVALRLHKHLERA